MTAERGGPSLADVAARARGRGPWSPNASAGVLVSHVVALTMVLAGAYQASHLGEVRSELAWLMVSFAGVALAGTANGIWLLQGRQALTAATVALLGPDALAEVRTATAVPGSSDPGHVDVETWVHAAAMTRYHRPSCPLAMGRDVVEVESDDVHRLDLLPCEVCEP